MLAWKTITLLWPFLKELFLGKKTLREALKTNKGRVFLIMMIIGSVVMNVWLIPNIVRISADYVDLKHKYDALKTQDEQPKATAPAAPAVPATPPEKVKADIAAANVAASLPAATRSPDHEPQVPHASVQQWSSYDATVARFNQMANRERR
jgi:uncharacterized membrane protein